MRSRLLGGLFLAALIIGVDPWRMAVGSDEGDYGLSNLEQVKIVDEGEGKTSPISEWR